MAKHRCHSIEFKRQVAEDFIAGETLHGLAKRHDISRNLIRVWRPRRGCPSCRPAAGIRGRDRLSTFNPQLIVKYQRRAAGRMAGTRAEAR